MCDYRRPGLAGTISLVLLFALGVLLWGPTLGRAAAAPVVTSIGPNNGTYGGGTSVMIAGTGFTPSSTVAFGGKPATSVTYNSSTSLTAKSPAGSEGALVDIQVTAETGTSTATPVDQFGYNPAPSGVWLGLAANSGTSIWGYRYQDHNIRYDRSWRLEVGAGTLPTVGSDYREALETSINFGMKPIIIIDTLGSSIPTGTAVAEYVNGFVATAKATRELYPEAEILFEPINEPYFRESGISGKPKRYADLIAALLPETNKEGIPAATIYVAAWGTIDGEEWIPKMYAAQSSLKTLVRGWNLHPYGRPGTGTNPDINHGIMNVPVIQSKMTSGQNNLIISEAGFCAKDLVPKCNGADEYSWANTSAEASGFLEQMLTEAKAMHEEGWLRALLVFGRTEPGWQMGDTTLTAQGTTLVEFGDEEDPTAPIARTETANAVGATGATLNAGVNPQGTASEYHFEYGTSTTYGNSTSSASAGSGISTSSVSKTVGSLAAATTYHYRVVASNSAGTTYGADSTFSTSGPPLIAEGGVKAVSPEAATVKAEINPSGFSTQYQFEYGLTTSYGSKAPVPSAGIGSGNSPVEATQGLTGLIPDEIYHARVVASSSQGTVYGGDFAFQTLSSPPVYLSFFGSLGSKEGQLSAPGDVAVGSGGNLWVVDAGNSRVEVFDSSGKYVTKFGSKGSKDGQFDVVPRALAIDPKGFVWVADDTRIQKFNEKGEYQSKFGAWGFAEGKFNELSGLAIDSKGNFWISNGGNSRVELFNEKGEFVKVIAQPGSNAGQVLGPAGIDVGPGGNVWVADRFNNRILKFDSAGTYKATFGTVGSGNGQLKEPVGISVDSRGVVWVAERGNNRVQAFSEAGNYLTKFGSAGSGEGQFSFAQTGLATDGQGQIWITDTGNNRVQKWSR